MFTVLLAYVVFLACFVVRDLCGDGCTQNYYLTPLPPPLPSHCKCLLTMKNKSSIQDKCLDHTEFC